ncbi:MAG: hypothetical protein ACHQ1E_04160 [Ktedonobacterales bacterium]|jgi:hypothetical protein
MRPLSEAADQELRWQGKEEFELRAGAETYAALHARERGVGWIIGEAAEGRWALRNEDLGSGEILLITEPDSRGRIAVVRHGRKRGLFTHSDDYIEFADSHIVTWRKANAWRDDEWDWVDRDRRPLIHFQREYHVVIEPAARSLQELSLLVVVGGQLIRLREAAKKKAAVLAGVATATASHVVVNH